MINSVPTKHFYDDANNFYGVIHTTVSSDQFMFYADQIFIDKCELD